MWVRFLQDIEGSHKGDVLWTDDDVTGQQLVDDGIVARCTGPDGIAFGESTPEDVQATIEAEERQKTMKGGE
jgi:hypothetical protein